MCNLLVIIYVVISNSGILPCLYDKLPDETLVLMYNYAIKSITCILASLLHFKKYLFTSHGQEYQVLNVL